MRLYSSLDMEKIPWGDAPRQSYLKPLLKEGSEAFIANVNSQLYILHIDDLFIPITLNNQEYSNSYVCSIYSYLLYAEEEMQRHKKTFLKALLFPLTSSVKLWFKLTKINKVVAVNNGFLSTNLYPKISQNQIERITHFLVRKFPQHTLLFRSLNDVTEGKTLKHLTTNGFDLITSRSVYFLNPETFASLPSKTRWILKKDRRLKENPDVEIVTHDALSVQDAPRLKALYDQLYLEKYSRYNPAFTERFFQEAILNKSFILTGVKYLGNLVGVIGYFKENGVMTTPIVGYDMSAPASLGLYRLLTSLIIEESLATKTLLNMSAGAARFKRVRGSFKTSNLWLCIQSTSQSHAKSLGRSSVFYLIK